MSPITIRNGLPIDDATGALAVTASGGGYDAAPSANGMIVTAPDPAYGSTGAIVAGTAYFTRFVAQRSMSITKMQVHVTAADGSNPLSSMALYSAAGARLGTSGDVASKLNATGMQTYNLGGAVALAAGQVYYAGWASAASITPASLASLIDQAYLFETAVGQVRCGYIVGTTVPATLAGLTNTPNGVLMAARES